MDNVIYAFIIYLHICNIVSVIYNCKKIRIKKIGFKNVILCQINVCGIIIKQYHDVRVLEYLF